MAIKTDQASPFTRMLIEYRNGFYAKAPDNQTFSQKVVVDITRRTVSLSVSMLLHAEAVCRAVYAFFLSIGSVIFNSFKQISAQQGQESKIAIKESISSVKIALGNKKVRFYEPPTVVIEHLPNTSSQSTQTDSLGNNLPNIDFTLAGNIDDESIVDLENRSQTPSNLSISGVSNISRASSQFSYDDIRDEYQFAAFSNLPPLPDEELRIKLLSGELSNIAQASEGLKEVTHNGYGLKISYTQGKNLLETKHTLNSFVLKAQDIEHSIHVFSIIQPTVGMRAALYVYEHLFIELYEQIKQFCSNTLTDEAVSNAIIQTTFTLNNNFLETFDKQKINSNLEFITDHGARLTLLIVIDEKLWVAQLGGGEVTFQKGQNSPFALVRPAKENKHISIIGSLPSQHETCSIPTISYCNRSDLEEGVITLNHNSSSDSGEGPTIKMEIKVPTRPNSPPEKNEQGRKSVSSDGSWEKDLLSDQES